MNYLRDLLYNSGPVRQERKSPAKAATTARSQADRKKSAQVGTKLQTEKATPRGDLLALLDANKVYCSQDLENHRDSQEGVVPSGSTQEADVSKIDEKDGDQGDQGDRGDVRSPGAGRMLNSIAAYAPQLPLEPEQVPPRTPSPPTDLWPVSHGQQDSDSPKYEPTTPSPKPPKKKYESPVLMEAVTILSEQLSPPGNKITDRWQLMSEYRNLDVRLMRLEAMEAVMRIQIQTMAPSGIVVIQQEEDDSAWEDEEDDSLESHEADCSPEHRDDGANFNIDADNIPGADGQGASFDDSTKSIDESLIIMSTLLPLGMAPLDSVSYGSKSVQHGDVNEEKSRVPEQVQCDWQYQAEMDESADFLRSNLKPGFCDPFDDEDSPSDIIDDQKSLQPRRPDYINSQATARWQVNTLDNFDERSNQENRTARDHMKDNSRRQHRRQRSVLSIDPFQFLRDDFDYLKKDNQLLPTAYSDSNERGQSQSVANQGGEHVETTPDTMSNDLNAKVARDIMEMLDAVVDEDSLQSRRNYRPESSHPVEYGNSQWRDARQYFSPTRSDRSASTISTVSTPRKSSCKGPRSACRRKGLHVRFNEFAEVRVISDTDERSGLDEERGWNW
ncbi:hypothetical protein V1520DRAFT_340980 [Lipomyces starkeyi]|uniref:Uncharacterized protein n=1 Tax=Lipomyces starkeyi NRRL Y-11557 TaxID=675824 RepID=A0A1E3PYI3_LIPST|nr:hypothetical protein LIPSTDRAFT_74821 [Lipomyces starkeyi NRRL Y-11557]